MRYSRYFIVVGILLFSCRKSETKMININVSKNGTLFQNEQKLNSETFIKNLGEDIRKYGEKRVNIFLIFDPSINTDIIPDIIDRFGDAHINLVNLKNPFNKNSDSYKFLVRLPGTEAKINLLVFNDKTHVFRKGFKNGTQYILSENPGSLNSFLVDEFEKDRKGYSDYRPVGIFVSSDSTNKLKDLFTTLGKLRDIGYNCFMFSEFEGQFVKDFLKNHDKRSSSVDSSKKRIQR